MTWTCGFSLLPQVWFICRRHYEVFPKVVTNLPAGTVRGFQQVIDRLRVPPGQ